MRSNMPSRRARTGPTYGSPLSPKGEPCGSKSPITAMTKGEICLQARRLASDWRTFGTGCRRPMARHIVSRPERTSEGDLALSWKSLTKPEKLPDEHSDHPGRRRTAGDAGPATEASGP